jgi:hypothetical protein
MKTGTFQGRTTTQKQSEQASANENSLLIHKPLNLIGPHNTAQGRIHAQRIRRKRIRNRRKRELAPVAGASQLLF